MSNGSKLLLVLTVIVSLLYYSIFHSALPIRLVTGIVSLSGLEFTDVDGSLESGVHIGSIKTTDGEFVVRNFRFDFNGLLSVWQTQELKIKEFNIDEFRYVQDSSPKTVRSKKEDEKDKSVSDKNKNKIKPDWLKLLSIDVLKIAKVHIKLNAFDQPFIMDEFKLEGFHSKNPNFFKTLAFSGNVGSLTLEPDQQGRGFKISFKALPSIFKVLKHELNVAGELMIEAGRLKNFHLAGFDGKFQATLIKDDLIVNFQDLDLSQYFNKEYAISRINGELNWGDFQHLSFENIAANNLSFNVGLTTFSFENKKLFEIDKLSPGTDITFQANHSPQLFINFTLVDSFSSKSTEKKKLLKANLVSIPFQDKLTLLTKVYYQILPEAQTPEQRAFIEDVAKYFE